MTIPLAEQGLELTGLDAAPALKEWFTYQDKQGRTVQVTGTDAYDELRQVKTETAIRRIVNRVERIS